MGEILSVQFGNQKPRKSRQAVIEDLLKSSKMEVRAVVGKRSGLPYWVEIDIHGALAHIPSMKRGKIPGTNFVNPTIIAKIKALDAAFAKAGAGLKSFGENWIVMTLICADRSREFDLVGCVETVQDWLEPASKPVGKKHAARGWGIGLIPDDKYIIPRPDYAWQLGVSRDYTSIILERWEDVREREIARTAAAMRGPKCS